jgi:hypothetical protein
LFKQSSYGLAHEHIEFWRNNKIFTDARIARMLEVELTSELLILAMAGLQDKKKSVNAFYADYDASFPARKSLESRFRSVVDEISHSTGDNLRESEFRRPPLFYSLFAAVYHRRFGVPGLAGKSSGHRLRDNERRALRSGIARLSDVISLAKDEEAVPRKYQRFVAASLRQTDNIQPRRTRTQAIFNSAFS